MRRHIPATYDDHLARRLRLYDPESSGATPHRATNPVGDGNLIPPGEDYWPLRRCLEESLLHKRAWTSERIEHYRRIVRQWETFHRAAGHLSDDQPLGPDVRDLRADAFNNFVQHMRRLPTRPWLSLSCCKSRLDDFKAVLKSVALRSLRFAEGLPAPAPYAEPPFLAPLPSDLRERPDIPDTLSLDQFSDLLKACDCASWPRRQLVVPSPVLWRAFLLLLWEYGQRKDSALRMTWQELDIGKMILRFKPDKRGDRVSIAIDARLRPLLAYLRRRSPDRVFPFPGTARTEAAAKFNPELKKIFATAGLEEHTCHFMRSCAITNWESLIGDRVRFVTGQRPSGVVQQHYDSPQAARREIARVMKKYPMPSADLLAPPAE